MPESRSVPPKTQLFATGCFGTLVVYAVFFLRHVDVVAGFVESVGGAYLVAAVVALLVIAVAGGFWTLLNEPQALKTAFSLGLGAPALFFASDLLAQSSPAPGDAGRSLPPPVYAMAVPLAADGPSVGLLDALRLVVSPVSAVSEERIRQADPQAARLRREMPRLEARVVQVERQLAQSQQVEQRLRVQVTQLEARSQELVRRVEVADREAATLKRQLRTAQQEEVRLRTKVERLERVQPRPPALIQ